MIRIRALRVQFPPCFLAISVIFTLCVCPAFPFTPFLRLTPQAATLLAATPTDGKIVNGSPLDTANDITEGRRKRTLNDLVQGSPPQQEKRDPWRATYHISRKTQQKIQQAAEDNHGVRRSKVQRAMAVLDKLLSIPPENCNAANLVCALTLSAKVLGSHGEPTLKFRSRLFQVLDVLHTLVTEQRLNSRQLCNAIWAVAKHYDRDPELLPALPSSSSLSSSQSMDGETWDLSDDNDDDHEISPQKLLDATVSAIARQLTSILRSETTDEEAQTAGPTKEQNANVSRETKLGEICMASWAFGVLRPRKTPPGWLEPPKVGKLGRYRQTEQSQTSRSENDFMSFKQWSFNDDDLSFLQPEDVPSLSQGANGKARDEADELFDAVSEALCRPLHSGDVMEPSMYDPRFDLMRITDCSWSEIANLAWAFEKRGQCQSTESETLLRALSREAAWRLKKGGKETKYMLSRDISQLIWALGTLQQDNFRLSHDLVQLVDEFSKYLGLKDRERQLRPCKAWSCPDIVQIILSLSHSRIDDSQLLLAMFEEAQSRLCDNGISPQPVRQEGRKVFLAWEVCVILWAQARLYLTSSEGNVYEEFPRVATSSLLKAAKGGCLRDTGVGPQEQANLAWSLTVLRYHQSNEAIVLLQDVFAEAAKASYEDGLIQLEHAHQLWQALFLLEEESPSAVSDVPTWFRDYLCDKWNLEKSKKKISSARHKSISDVLNLMGVAHVNEHDEDIDVAIVLKSQASWAHETGEGVDAMKIAVEFDGPNHFTRKSISQEAQGDSGTVRALGHTVLKYRLLKQIGWTVIRVPYYEFDKIPFWASMERQRYLQRLLKTHANIKFSSLDVSEYTSMGPNRRTRFD